ncbi:MAG: hypothetical protein SFX73_00645 [Kofleriaceae bacterium]|nr:hypothetical protein [Kofleriaceae bacterium]
MRVRIGWDGSANALAFATDNLLQSSESVHDMDMLHDFMWLVRTAGALKVVVHGFSTPGFIKPAEADQYLASVLQASGSAPDSHGSESLANLEGLTDRQMLRSAIAHASTDIRSSSTSLAHSTM